VQKGDRALFEEIFYLPPSIENLHRLSRENQEYCNYLLDLGHRITFIEQDSQEGFGHAVLCAREWVGDEPFLLLLGDHLYASDTDISCAGQLLEVYERVRQSVVGLKVTPAEQLKNFGCVTGEWREPDTLLAATELREKPDIEYAREHLHVDGMEPDRFLTVFGCYVLTPRIFEYLDEHVRRNLREGGEFQLTGCLDRLRREEGVTGYTVKGRRFDIGLPEAYRQTLIDFRNA